MYTDTEGIILRQTKTVNGRRMVLLFSKKYGKISAGTGISEKGRSKAALAMRPFAYGRYEIFKSRQNFNINGAEVLKSYYKIGEDVDKYMNSSYILELTEKLLAEEQQNTKMFDLLLDFFDAMENRKKKYMTLVLAYETKALGILGYMPELSVCIICGKKNRPALLDIKEGGIVCRDCANNIDDHNSHTLIYDIDFGIVDILKYFSANSLKNLENLALEGDKPEKIKKILGEYISYHLEIDKMKSEKFLTDN